MNIFEIDFRQIKENEGIKTWQGETIHKIVIGYGFEECKRFLQSRYGKIEIDSMQNRYEIDYMTPQVVHNINGETCREYREKLQKIRKKQDKSEYKGKPSNVTMEG